jgi:hypothetical protein
MRPCRRAYIAATLTAAVAASPVTSIAAAPSTFVTPPWNAPFAHHGYQCVDASVNHAPRQENNTRWAFYAIPEGDPPPDGFPIYLEFLAEPFGDGQFDQAPGKSYLYCRLVP